MNTATNNEVAETYEAMVAAHDNRVRRIMTTEVCALLLDELVSVFVGNTDDWALIEGLRLASAVLSADDADNNWDAQRIIDRMTHTAHCMLVEGPALEPDVRAQLKTIQDLNPDFHEPAGEEVTA